MKPSKTGPGARERPLVPTPRTRRSTEICGGPQAGGREGGKGVRRQLLPAGVHRYRGPYLLGSHGDSRVPERGQGSVRYKLK